MNARITVQAVKEAGEKVAIGPKTLALLRRPSAMRKLDERAITEVTEGMGKWVGKMSPSQARGKLTAGRMRALMPSQSAAHTVAEKAKFEDSAGQKLLRAVTGQKQRPSVPRLFKDTEAAQGGRAWRKADDAIRKGRKAKAKGPSAISKATEKVKGLAADLKPSPQAKPIMTPAMA